MMPYTERFDDFEILTLRFTILRNCPNVIIVWVHLQGGRVRVRPRPALLEPCK